MTREKFDKSGKCKGKVWGKKEGIIMGERCTVVFKRFRAPSYTREYDV